MRTAISPGIQRHFTIFLALFLTWCASGCSRRASATMEHATASPARWIVYEIDITGSYTMPRQALDQAAQEVLHSAVPGDTWFFRYLHNKSYNDHAAILTLRCPLIKTTHNVLARQQQSAQERSAAKMRSDAARYLESLHPQPVYGTDIYGALAKAGELLADAPAGADRVLVLATDLGDTLRRPAEIKLTGVRVIVTLFQSGSDPRTAARLRRDWTKKIKGYGASEVTFIDPSETGRILAQ